MTGVYRIADKNIAIVSVFRRVHDMADAYRTDGPADITVCTDMSDIQRERSHTDNEYTDEYLETLAVYRKIAEVMPFYDTFLFHGSCIAVDDRAYIFTAPSGTGKSTHTRLWRELLGERAVMVNDDKPLIRVCDDGTFVYGTPWDGKHHLSSNISVRLRAVCLLERNAENRISRITPSEAIPILIQQSFRPSDPAALARTLTLIERMGITCFRLGCNMDISAAELSYNTMKEEDI